MKCPKCGGEVFLRVITDDDTGETFTSTYHCGNCKVELPEDEVIDENIVYEDKIIE